MAESSSEKTAFSSFGLASQRDAFVENLSTLVASGMGVAEAIAVLKTEILSSRMRRSVDSMYSDIESGFPLWRVFERARFFPSHIISLIRVGEESGKLSENLQMISSQQQKEREFRSKMRSAMMYPFFVLGLTGVIGIGIAWFILPKLAIVFSQLHVALPPITRALIVSGEFLQAYGTVAVPIVIGVIIVFIFFLFFFSRTKQIGQSILFSFPGIRTLLQEAELARMSYIIGTLLQSGIPVTQTMLSLAQSTTFPRYARFYSALAESIEEGNSFQRSFSEYPQSKKLFPAGFQQLIGVAEKTGTLPDAFLKMSRLYEGKTEMNMKNLSVILEPVLLVVVWLGVVGVALAVILPIYSLIGNLNVQ
ncbi:MAG: type II secretion system F family protein [Candidatus Moraniibacteriota bacterium]